MFQTYSSGRSRQGFTLVEILIVVVILGILAAMVVPQYANATSDAKKQATVDQLVKLRQALGVYYVRNNARFPNVSAGNGSWGELMTSGYFLYPPANLVAGTNGSTITFGTGPDASPTSAYGWIFNPATGDVWASCFDANDKPLP
ncbi:MAG: prepilin-type N-terminal cleavage/methylation domain-containing protein [Phycisphaeraceae bacterium]|nr:prepilin-type N-terminal cleavage/methylation domain-containing protein [Phycisphaeraceae bacterium]